MPIERVYRRDVSVERTKDGSLLLAVIANGHRIKYRYYGYTKREAMTAFMRYVREQLP